MPIAMCPDGLIGIGRGECAYIFDKDMNLLDKKCGRWRMYSASCSENGILGFSNKDGCVYLFRGGKFWNKIYIGWVYKPVITVLPDGFILCDDDCALFDFSKNRIWAEGIRAVESGPAVYKGYVYVPDYKWDRLRILRLKDGREVNGIGRIEGALSVSVCKDYLAVGASWHLYLYDVSDPANPRELWSAEGFWGARRAAFSPGCSALAVCNECGGELKFFSADGKFLGKKAYGSRVLGVVWGEDAMLVETEDRVYVYKFMDMYGPVEAPHDMRARNLG